MQFNLAKFLTTFLDLAPDVAHLAALVVKAKSAKGPGGKKITDDERADLEDALAELLGDIRK